MELLSAREAVARISDGSRVILPHGCVEPTAFYEALQQERARFRQLQLYSGLQFGDYPFLAEGLGENFGYTTWQASAKLRPLFRQGKVDFLPLRFSEVTRIVAHDGPVRPDVVVIQTTPVDDEWVNLGISVSLYRELVESARLVIAEINPNLPATFGNTKLPAHVVDIAIESDRPLGEYRSPRRTSRDEQIVDRVLALIPDGAWVQLGVGAIPDAVLGRLHELRDINLQSGMLTDGLIEFLGKCRHRPRVITGEICGSPALYQLAAEDDAIQLHPTSVTHDVGRIGRLPRFVSINSAVEVDLFGQINGETIDGLQISGAGGSLDFVEGALMSRGGMAILALPSTTEDGSRSKIVRRLGADTPATIPRVCADYVVTEHGVAALRGRTLRQRAEALQAIAAPGFRDALL
ncbi:MAG TPA: acetyl-CoA hydrolase/transferase C-terminal domain-containing protein [Terriglobales bacterium]|nr:acetyl-CoA hydrolase/transferase C-terminal domain-containing protein [Terriglobales bacterium]